MPDVPPDAPPSRPPHGDAPASRPTLGGQLRQFGLLVVAVTVLGLLAGWLFAKGQPRSAAGALIADFVVVEAPTTHAPDEPADPDAVAPSSGAHDGGQVRCGLVTELSNADHVASLAAGIVVVRHDLPDPSPDDLAALAALANRREVLVAREPRLDVPVVALAWGRRMELGELNLELLRAFHTAHVDLPVPGPVDELPTDCHGA